jgi:hypothetical protein
MKSYYIFIAFIIYSILKQLFKGQRKEKTNREAQIRRDTAKQFINEQPVAPNSYSTSSSQLLSSSSSQSEVEAAIAKLRGRAVTMPLVKLEPIAFASQENDSYSQANDYESADQSEAERRDAVFRPNEGFSKTQRVEMDRLFDDVTDSYKPRAKKFAYTSDTIRNYFIMKEVLEAPRAMRPHLARRSYYDPHDTSRE